MSMSVISHPTRGKWGKSSWRGNCSGHVYKDIFEQLRPETFCDPMVGSGTSVEVASEMGIEAFGLDLHSGFNILRHSILDATGKPVDLCLSHPPYHDMIVYSGNVYPGEHPDDLSRCADPEEFMDKLQQALLNQREAVNHGGFYGTIIGDLRRNGHYWSFQADAIARMPADELRAVLIKAQHNVQSASRQYAGMRLPRVAHEYILLWQRPDRSVALLSTLSSMAHSQQRRLRGSWKAVVRQALVSLGGEAPLSRLYEAVAENAPDKLAGHQHWREKVRQTLYVNDWFAPVERGVWRVA